MPITKSQRFQLSYKESDVDKWTSMEQEIMDKLNISSRSNLHTKAIKHLHNLTFQKDLYQL